MENQVALGNGIVIHSTEVKLSSKLAGGLDLKNKLQQRKQRKLERMSS